MFRQAVICAAVVLGVGGSELPPMGAQDDPKLLEGGSNLRRMSHAAFASAGVNGRGSSRDGLTSGG